MLKTELEVVAIGEPNIAALQESERRLFFETLYARVLELAKKNPKRFVVIDASMPVDEVSEKIKTELNNRFNLCLK